MNPTAAVLLIGDELLSGRTPDANMPFIAKRMSECGISLKECRVVADDKVQIIDALNALRAAYTYVFTTGGIGPTHDDITMACVAEAFGVAIVRDRGTEEAFREHYGRELKPATLKMADVPEGASLIDNPLSIAPGVCMGNVYVLAGVPSIMQVMLDSIVPTLQKGDVVQSRNVDVFAGESVISEGLSAVQDAFSDSVSIGSYPFEGRKGANIVVRGVDISKVSAAFEAVLTFLDKIGVEYRV